MGLKGGGTVSFSGDVKRELAAIRPEAGCCLAAQAYGMAEGGHAFGGGEVSLQTEYRDVAERYRELLTLVCRLSENGCRLEDGRGGFTMAAVREDRLCRRVLERFGHTVGEVAVRINRANLECDGCVPAYLRGLFLSCGVVTDPSSDYHLEFSLPYYNLSRDLTVLLAECGLRAKLTRRGGCHIVYFKESEQIEDCLTLIGATNASLELMGVKLVKNIRNNANRVANCETANIDKTVAAAAVQVEAVRKLSRSGGLERLPEELRELALLRLENPDMSLRELGAALEPPLSRSGVNHRLRRILAFAQES